VKIKVIVIILVAFMASIYGYWSYQQQLLALQASRTYIDDVNQQSPPLVLPAAQKPAPKLSLEQQLQQQFALQASAQSYLKQQNSAGSENPLDEELVTEVGDSDSSTPYPSRFNRRLDERGVLLGDYAYDHGRITSIARRWNASSGEMKTILALNGFHIYSAVITKNGIFFLVQEPDPDAMRNLTHVVFVSLQGYATTAVLKVPRTTPIMLLLSDQSVLLTGGFVMSATDRHSKTPDERSNAVEWMRFDGENLLIEQLPDIPGPSRWGYALAPLADAGAMVLGGNTSQYVGCKAPECKSETYVLDTFTKVWSNGPELLEPRADASAALLADGSILVAGGWRADSAGNALRSRSSERWLPNSHHFKAAATLAIPVAKHRFVNVNANNTSPLLLIDTKSGSVQTYDLVRNEWRVIGEFSSALDYVLGPFVDNKNIYMWAGHEGDYKEWQRITLGVPSGNLPASPTQFDVNKGMVFYRAGMSFLEVDANHGAIVAGGSMSSDWLPSSAVDIVTVDGKVQPLAPLNTARTHAQVFRMSDGAIAVAGGDADFEQTGRSNPQLAPLEWLAKPDTQSRWQTLSIERERGNQYVQLSNGNILVVHADGSMAQLQFSINAQQNPVVTSKFFATAAPMQRTSAGSEPLWLKGLSDGRLIVAGGSVQTRRIVVLRNAPDNDVSTAVADEDEYVGTGDFKLSSTYDIYSPKTQTWRTSAAAHSAEGSLVILADGRVLKISAVVAPTINKAEQIAGETSPAHILEISHQDGSSWSALPSKNTPEINLDDAELLLVSDEIFMSGKAMNSSGNIPTRLIQWYDMSAQRWYTVWHSSNRIHQYQTRLLVLTLANKKTVILPVQER
jgi:hypothetical protein